MMAMVPVEISALVDRLSEELLWNVGALPACVLLIVRITES